MPALRKDIVKETTDIILGEIAKAQTVKNWDNYHLAELLHLNCNALHKLYRFKKQPKRVDLEFLILLLDTLGLKIEIKEKFVKK